MKLIKALAGATVALLPCIFQPSLAVTFGQTEVNQDKLIAIAVPHSSGYYSLIVLEQLSDKKPCWRESGSKPTQVEPLLVNFNFTGICGRSTDSNGYSLRVAGQDLGMTYRLSIQKHNGDLLLLGMPSSEKSKPVEVGRTHGMRSGFLKFDLSPGWQFAKRTYNGKTLGHVYISRGTPAPIYQIAQSSSGKPAENKPTETKPAANKPAEIKPVANKPVENKPSQPLSAQPLPTQIQPPKPPKPTESLPARPKSSMPPSEVAAKPTRPALFPGKPVRSPIVPERSRGQLVPSSVTSSRPPSTNRPPISSQPKLDRPGRRPILGQPSTPKPSNQLYQVMVVAPDATQQDKVRDKMPSAFRTSYKGKTVMQVGLFSDRRKAESLKTDLKHEGFKVLLTQKKTDKTAALSESEGEAIASDSSTSTSASAVSVNTGISAQAGAITVPNAEAPIGNVKGAQNVYQTQGYLAKASALPPPPPPKAAGSRYRIIVLAQGDDQQAKIRALVPGAFRVRYKGQSVMQVGSFSSTEEATPVLQLMEQHGFTPVTDRS
jgi:Protein of unknown function (DUF3747)